MEAGAAYVSLNFVYRDGDADGAKEMRSMEGRGRAARVSRPSLPLASSLISVVNPGHLFCGSGAVRDVAPCPCPSDRTSALPLGET